jgi:transcription elongation factor
MFPQAYSPGITFAPDVENPGPLVGFKASLRADDPGDHLEALEGRLVNGGKVGVRPNGRVAVVAVVTGQANPGPIGSLESRRRGPRHRWSRA